MIEGINRFVCFGEIMLRLKPPGRERFLQTPAFEASFGGSEANVSVGLARFGLKSYFVTLIPDNPIGEAAISELLRYGVDVSYTVKKKGRLGLYYLEQGANQRPSRIIYDREGSSFSKIEAGDINWDELLDENTWFHFSGITPAISKSLADETLRVVNKANKMGSVISCDLNYRRKLWNYGVEAPVIMDEIVRNVDYLFANEEDVQMTLGINVDGIDIEGEKIEKDRYKKLTGMVIERYPNLKKVAITIRESFSADHSGWSSVLNNGENFIVSRRYNIEDIVDRIGAGDAFDAGMIFGLCTMINDHEALEFATAASCLKHSIQGDMPLITVDEVFILMKSAGSGRIQR